MLLTIPPCLCFTPVAPLKLVQGAYSALKTGPGPHFSAPRQPSTDREAHSTGSPGPSLLGLDAMATFTSSVTLGKLPRSSHHPPTSLCSDKDKLSVVKCSDRSLEHSMVSSFFPHSVFPGSSTGARPRTDSANANHVSERTGVPCLRFLHEM